MNALRRHYPEYLIEAAGLGLLMMMACGVTVLVEHPASLIRDWIHEPMLRRLLIGITMGSTVITLIYSPWGKQSGAHFNPVVTLTFFRLGKIHIQDAIFYVLSQIIGGWVGVLCAAQLWRAAIAHPAIHYVVTVPGSSGVVAAFLAELIMSFGVMITVLTLSNTPTLSRWTGCIVGGLIAVYITVAAPLSGMSLNPARTLASALPAHTWTAIWIYFTAPLLGMGLAAELYVQVRGRRAVRCAKLHHDNLKRCIFRCGYRPYPTSHPNVSLSDRLPTDTNLF